MQVCPSCKSTRIGHYRMDSDWCHGGDWYAENSESKAAYTNDDIDGFRNNDKPNVECCVCCECNTCFEPVTPNV